MKRITISLHEQVAREIRSAAEAQVEMAGVLIVGTSETDDELRLLGRDFIPAPTEAYDQQTARRLVLASSAYMPALARAAELGAAALFVHTHPRDLAEMSVRDDEVDEALRDVFELRTANALYGSLVLNVRSDVLEFSGRIWRGNERLGPITVLREVGDRFRFTSSIDAPEPLPTSEVFDRQVRAFGDPIQQLLRRLHIGVVGNGGTGSSVGEQLIRLGVGQITTVDYDTLTATNVTRVYGSSVGESGEKKTEIMRRNAETIGLGTVVTVVDGKADTVEAMRALSSCDVIFGCTDDASGRLAIARLAYWCLIPVLDVGVMLDSRQGDLVGIFARLDVQVPGAACVQCVGQVNQERLAAEQLESDELKALQAEGYAPELDTRDPAVIAYTTMIAATAVSELLLRLTGAGVPGVSRVMIRAHDRQILNTHVAGDPDHWCAQQATWGTGVTRTKPFGRAWGK